jgi:hypothetical protein
MNRETSFNYSEDQVWMHIKEFSYYQMCTTFFHLQQKGICMPQNIQGTRHEYKTHHIINPVLKLPYLHSYTYHTCLVRRLYYITLIKILCKRNTLITITEVQNFSEWEMEFTYISHRYHTLLNTNIHTYLITAIPYRHLIWKNMILYSVPPINVNTAVT